MRDQLFNMVQKMQTNDKKCLLKRSPLSTTGYLSAKGIARLCVAFYLTLNAKHPLKYKKIPFWNLLVWRTTEIILNLFMRLSYYWAVLPMAGQSVFSHLCRKTNTRRKEDRRSGTEETMFSHIISYDFPLHEW